MQELAIIDRFGYLPEQFDKVKDVGRLLRYMQYDGVKEKERQRRERIAAMRRK